MSPGYISRSGTAGSHSNCVQPLQELPGCFPTGCVVTRCHQRHEGPCSNTGAPIFFIRVILVGVRRHVLWFWLALSSRIEHLLLHLLASGIYCLEMRLCKSFALKKKSDDFFFSLLSSKSSSYIPDACPLSDP